MKKTILIVAVLALFTGTVANAQNRTSKRQNSERQEKRISDDDLNLNKLFENKSWEK